MLITTYPHKLIFKYPFKIAHTYRDHTLNTYLLVKNGKYWGWGEAVFPPYMPESRDSFMAFMNNLCLPDDPERLDLTQYLPMLHKKHPNDTFAIAALDIALHNLKENMMDKSIMKQYNIKPQQKHSSFTLGISDKPEMEKKVKENDALYYKLKVNEEEMERIINDFKTISKKPFVVDANQGFQAREKALEWCEMLADDNVAYMEQPFSKEDFESHKWLKERSPIPIIADESYQRISDLEKVSQYFDGINVKVMKSGGLEEAQRALKKANAIEMKTILGCMSESSVAVNAAWQLAPLADWVDLDGPLLIKNDPFQLYHNYQDVETFLKSFLN